MSKKTKKAVMSKKTPKKDAKKAKKKLSPKQQKTKEKAREASRRADKLIAKGKERGFITYDEILKEFPTVEDDIIFLDDLYSKLSTAGVDVLESGGMLDIEPPVKETGKKYGLGRLGSES